jgi:ribosomal protein S1
MIRSEPNETLQRMGESPVAELERYIEAVRVRSASFRVGRGMREISVAYTQGEWDELVAKYPPGTPVAGAVTSCHAFGIFIRLEGLPDVPALLEIIHFRVRETEPDHRIEFPADYPSVGDRVEARILGWCLRPKDVRLTQLSHLDWIPGRRSFRSGV